MPPMPKRLLVATVLLSILAAAPTARADVPDDKTGRIREYRDRRFEITQPSSTSYEVRVGTGTESIRVRDRVLAERADDVVLLEKIDAGQRSRSIWQLSWSLGVPLGVYLFFDNFLGNPRPAGLAGQVPAPVVSFYPANDLRSYALATGGAVLAAYGASQLAGWVAERFGWQFASFLKPEEAKKAANTANNRLLDELALSLTDVTAASPSAGTTAAATASAGTTVTLQGEEGSAAFYVARAVETLRNQRGAGYRLYMVYTKDMGDKSGKLQRGSWRYLFYNPQTLDSQEVNVPVFGASPTVGPAPDAFKDWRTAPSLADQWKVDSPKAMTMLSEALMTRGIPWLVDEATLLLYPYYGNFQVPVWVIDQGTGPLLVGVDGAAAIAVDLAQSGRNVQPGAGGVTPPTSPGGPTP